MIRSLPQRIRRLFLFLPLALGIFLRLYSLGSQSLFLDEAWSWGASRLSFFQILTFTRIDPHPPLFYLLLKGAQAVLPSSEWGVRILPASLSILSLIALVFFTARWWGNTAAFFAGWFIALSSFDLYYAQEARMYSLLALLCFLSFGVLTEALSGRKYLYPVWGALNLLILSTQYYGFLFVGVELCFLCGYWLLQASRRELPSRDWRWVLLGAGISLLGCFWGVMLVWNRQTVTAGGGRIPQINDLFALPSLIFSGLASVPDYFVDGAHLIPQFMAALPPAGWYLVAIGFLCLLVYGLRCGWRGDQHQRRQMLLSILLIVAPIFFVLPFFAIFRLRYWALKPFLGLAYLVYLWMGVGLSQLRNRVLQSVVLLVYLLVSLATITSYFSTWQKSDARRAFQSFSQSSSPGDVLFLERAYVAPLAFYYLGSDQKVWGFQGSEGKAPSMVELSSPGVSPANLHPLDCSDIHHSEASDVWIYGTAERIRTAWPSWPSCLLSKRLWLFESGEWEPLLNH